MDGTQWECNSSDTLLNDFFSQDDLKQLAVDAGIMLECPLLVLDDTFHVVAYYYPIYSSVPARPRTYTYKYKKCKHPSHALRWNSIADAC